MGEYDEILDRKTGVKAYIQDVRHLRKVKDGRFEGALRSFRDRATTLLSREAGLTQEQRTDIISRLAGSPKYALEKVLENLLRYND